MQWQSLGQCVIWQLLLPLIEATIAQPFTPSTFFPILELAFVLMYSNKLWNFEGHKKGEVSINAPSYQIFLQESMYKLKS